MWPSAILPSAMTSAARSLCALRSLSSPSPHKAGDTKGFVTVGVVPGAFDCGTDAVAGFGEDVERIEVMKWGGAAASRFPRRAVVEPGRRRHHLDDVEI